MRQTALRVFMVVAMCLAAALAVPSANAQNSNSNSATGQMKQSGSEVGHAGRSMGHNVKHGRVLRGGKHFGKHMGRAGKHFGRGTKKVFKRAVS